MSKLIKELMIINNLRRDEAKLVAASMISYLEYQIKHGKEVNLGFLKMVPKASKPTTIKCNVGGKKSVIHMGETTRWHTRIAKSWQRKNKPFWSRY
jgi:hypothetical protein